MNKISLKIAWERFVENKVQSFVYVVGLAVSMVISMLIGLWIHSKISYSRLDDTSGHIITSPQNTGYNSKANKIAGTTLLAINDTNSFNLHLNTRA